MITNMTIYSMELIIAAKMESTFNRHDLNNERGQKNGGRAKIILIVEQYNNGHVQQME